MISRQVTVFVGRLFDNLIRRPPENQSEIILVTFSCSSFRSVSAAVQDLTLKEIPFE